MLVQWPKRLTAKNIKVTVPAAKKAASATLLNLFVIIFFLNLFILLLTLINKAPSNPPSMANTIAPCIFYILTPTLKNDPNFISDIEDSYIWSISFSKKIWLNNDTVYVDTLEAKKAPQIKLKVQKVAGLEIS